MNIDEIKRDERINFWFVNESIKTGSQEQYLRAMKQFIDLVGKTPTQLIAEADTKKERLKSMRDRNVTLYLMKFKAHLESNKSYTENTIQNRLYAVRGFYQANYIELPRMKNSQARPTLENKNPRFGKEDVKKMVQYCQNPRDRAIILAMKSSGMARKETRDLTYKSFREGYDKETKIATIIMRRAKVGQDFVTFIDNEGTEAIMDYLRFVGRVSKDGAFDAKYDSYPLFTTLKQHNGKIPEITFMDIFRRLSVKLGVWGVAPKPNKFIYNPLRSHNLRKFFKTALIHDGMDNFLIEYMMGHITDSTDTAYYLEDAPRLKDIYMQHMHALLIFSDASDYNKDMEKENKQLKSEIEKLKKEQTTSTPEDEIRSLMDDMKRMQERIDAIAGKR